MPTSQSPSHSAFYGVCGILYVIPPLSMRRDTTHGFRSAPAVPLSVCGAIHRYGGSYGRCPARMYAGIARSCGFSWVALRTLAHMGVCVSYATVYARVHTIRIRDAHPRLLCTPSAPCDSSSQTVCLVLRRSKYEAPLHPASRRMETRWSVW
ncbi:hypothetical protein C8F04DRAFT_1129200 [Mycena alexandri]|uniref:Transposase n=1 Tax=Mycena alexandri TaxID=1745969 RepID=A0AAD6SDG1_9AGAR|nr:hypothetical protein C8F04DRAFT_1129200 [Mycena alexandri]